MSPSSRVMDGKEYEADQAEVVDDQSDAAEVNVAFAPFLRVALRAQGIHQYLRLRMR